MANYDREKYFHICENVIIEKDTNTLSIIKDFDNAEYPILEGSETTTNILKQFFVVFSFYGEPWEYFSRLNIDAPDGSPLIALDTLAKIDKSSKTAIIIWNILLTFKGSGDYKIRVSVGDTKETIEERDSRILSVQPPKK